MNEERLKLIIKIIQILLAVAISVAVAVFVFSFLKSSLLDPVKAGSTEPIFLLVKSGTNFSQIAAQLKEQNLVRYVFVPKVIARLQHIDKQVRAGEYELSKGMTPKEILRKLISGEIVKRRITITEGMTVRDIARVVGASGLMSEEEFSRFVADTTLLKKWGIPNDTFEGYLFPQTYFFSKPITGEEVIASMIKEGEKIWPEAYSIQAENLGFTRHEILTFASIIEKESGRADDQVLISSVFYNRLKKNMKLQADPTVIYGIPNFNGNLTKEDLQRPSPYNTYVIEGLPKGPIANPGKSAIKAALYPVNTDYLYFVADGKGGHTFSSDLGNHNKAVSGYVESEKEKIKQQPVDTPQKPEQKAIVTPGTSGLRPTPKTRVITVH